MSRLLLRHFTAFGSVSAHLGKSFAWPRSNQALLQRLQRFEQLQHQYHSHLERAPRQPITITLNDGQTVAGTSYQTTPLSIAQKISRSMGQNSLVAKVQYHRRVEYTLGSASIIDPQERTQSPQNKWVSVDMSRPLEGDCSIQFVGFDDHEGKKVFWHSSAHMLGEALENSYGAWLCHGPAIEKGFFYDSFMGQKHMGPNELVSLEKVISDGVQKKHNFERIVLTKEQALKLFEDNPFKTDLIQRKIPANTLTVAYRYGNLIDLCAGPHIPSGDRVRGFKVTSNSAAYWLGNKQNDQLQRVYGISFPKQSQLSQYIKQQEQLARRNHRNIGQQQQLFSLSPMAAGSPIFLPHGTVLYNKLIELMRRQYRLRGYQEVITPNLYHTQLWKTSGHFFKYHDAMFFIKQGEEELGIKPMNCPGHCLVFAQKQHSYRDLPIRYADFGVLHRNQLAGTLTGLTRLRKFQQDDAHIFCRPDQIRQEIMGVLDLIDYIYTLFGFTYRMELSTRPQHFLGSTEQWNEAEKQLRDALEQFGKGYRVNQGDGAFYGPKIDLKLYDVFEREHQTATIQLDFQLPARFNLQYRSQSSQQTTEQVQEEENELSSQSQQAKYGRVRPVRQGFERPVVIHRAVFGSLERFIAILCEHTGGKWEFWLSPRQVKVLSVIPTTHKYAEVIHKRLVYEGYQAEIDKSGDSLSKQVRNARLDGFTYLAVVGKDQEASKTVSLRKIVGEANEEQKCTLDELLKILNSMSRPKPSRAAEEVSRSI